MIEIPLTRGQVALIDDEDYKIVFKFKWYAQWNSHTKSFYACSRVVNLDKKWTTILMHRLIMNAKQNQQVDHIKHLTLDNRKSQLRLCTHADNMHNTRKRIDNSSGYKGVCYRPDCNLWRSRITINGKRISLGSYHSPEEAYEAYCRAAIDLHGEFSMLD